MRKKMRYFEITTDSQDMTALNASPLSPAPSIAQWLTTHPNWSLYDNADPLYYPSLVCPDHITSATFTIDNTLSSQLISGSHPPHRPK